jgi:hypothetical protein
MSPIAKLFLAGGGVGFTYYMFMRPYWFPNPYKTRGVQNIEDRFSSGGATATHTPGVATKLGTHYLGTFFHGDLKCWYYKWTGSTDNTSRAEGGHKGPDSEHFKDNFGSQKTDGGMYPDKFYEQQYNSSKGK